MLCYLGICDISIYMISIGFQNNLGGVQKNITDYVLINVKAG